MKAYLNLNQTSVADALQDLPQIDQVNWFKLQDTLTIENNSLIVVDDQVAVKDVIDFRNTNPTAHIFYLITLYADSVDAQLIQSALKPHGIRVLPPLISGKQIVKEIELLLFAKQKGKNRVVGVLGSHSGIGKTTSLYMIGKQLVDLYDIRVGVLGLDGWNPGVTSIPYEGKFLDEIWGVLDGRQMQPEDLLERMHQIHPNLSVLGGNRDLLKIYTYTPDGIAYLIQIATQCFDLVLLDLGNHMDNPLSVQGLLSSDLKLVFASQRTVAKENWTRMKEQILERELNMEVEQSKDTWLVCSMMQALSDLETSSQLSNFYRLPCMASLPFIQSFYRHDYQKDLMKLSDKKYISESNRIADAISDFYRFPLKEMKKKKFALRGR